MAKAMESVQAGAAPTETPSEAAAAIAAGKGDASLDAMKADAGLPGAPEEAALANLAKLNEVAKAGFGETALVASAGLAGFDNFKKLLAAEKKEKKMDFF